MMTITTTFNHYIIFQYFLQRTNQFSFAGSPFQLKVGAQPDASKVRVTGPGVEHGILATYQSRFIVETRGAGAGQLTVRIRGPKGRHHWNILRKFVTQPNVNRWFTRCVTVNLGSIQRYL